MKKKIDLKKIVLIIIGLLLVIVGLVLMLNSLRGITGRVIAQNYDEKTSAVLGVLLFSSGLFLISLSHQKKGQAAMEFIMTYGWAILATLVAVAMLAYFGIFGGGSLFGSATQVQMSPPFTVPVAAIGDGGDSVTLEITNNGGNTKTIQTVAISACGSLTNVNVPVNSGGTYVAVVACNQVVTKFVSNTITITYTNPGSTLPQSSTGTLSGTPAPNYYPIQSNWNPPDQSTIAYQVIQLVFDINDDNALCTFSVDQDLGYPETDTCNNDLGIVTCNIIPPSPPAQTTISISCSGAVGANTRFDNTELHYNII